MAASVVLSPGFLAVFLYRLSSAVYGKRLLGRIFSKAIWRLNVLLTGCHISAKCRIGPGLSLPHPVGIVIGDEVSIGNSVTIFQSVTIGTSKPGKLDYPAVGDGVVIYCGTVVVGDIEIGSRALIGANSFVNTNVASDSVAVGCPAKVVCKRSAE